MAQFRNGLGQEGFSLISIMVTAGIGAALALQLGSVTAHSYRAQHKVTQRASFSQLARLAQQILSSPERCTGALQPASGKPTYTGNAGSSLDLQRVQSGAVIAAEVGASLEAGMQLTALRIVPTGLAAVPYPGNRVRHSVHLILEAASVGGAYGAPVLTEKVPFDLITDLSGEIETCTASGSSLGQLETAIASRAGFAIEGLPCQADLSDAAFRPLFEGNACAVGSSGTYCVGHENANFDTPGMGRRPKDRHHDFSTHPNSTWMRWQDPANSSIGASAAGRCRTSTVKVPEQGMDPNAIFSLINRGMNGTGADGIGCNSAAGWQLTGCTYSADGRNDGDTQIVSAGGNEYCTTADFHQPHRGDQAWQVRSVKLTVVCARLK